MRVVEYKNYGPPEVLKIVELEKPVPKDNEVLIKIHSTTVTAVDSIFRSGKSYFARMATGLTKPKIKILGSEFAGEIESVGKNVKSFKKGDRVFGDSSKKNSSHAEYISLPEESPITLIPENINYDEAASVPYGSLTALPFIRDNGNIKPGHKILIIGASGSVGSFAVQFAKHFGAEVTGICSSYNLELVNSLGADKVIDYTEEDFTNNGEKYDIIFDTVGKSSFSECKNSLNASGKYLTTVIGIPILLQMLMTSISGKKKAVIAFTGLRPDKDKLKDLLFIKDLLQKNKLKPIIDKQFPFEKIVDAHRYVDKGHKKGNVVINIS